MNMKKFVWNGKPVFIIRAVLGGCNVVVIDNKGKTDIILPESEFDNVIKAIEEYRRRIK